MNDRGASALRGWRHMVCAALVFAVAVTAGDAARACSFHTYLPERTLVDHIIAADAVVLARLADGDPYRFQASEVVRGTAPERPIPHLVDTNTRRRFASGPADTVLFAFNAATDRWQRLLYVEQRWRPIVDTILRFAPVWASGEEASRAAFAASLLTRDAPALRSLALSELDRVSYPALAAANPKIDVARHLARLWRPAEMAYQPIRILLLGFSDDPAARAAIHAAIERSAHFRSSANLGPWATALVEIDGASGVAMLDRMFLRADGHSAEAQELVVEALAIHRNAAPAPVVAAIDAVFQRAVDDNPQHAAMIARQLASRNDFSHAATVEETLRGGRLASGPDIISVATYIAMAKQRPQPVDAD